MHAQIVIDFKNGNLTIRGPVVNGVEHPDPILFMGMLELAKLAFAERLRQAQANRPVIEVPTQAATDLLGRKLS